jgi:uncharacterized SAM-binding protein YcdF (DUF218 family)
VLTVFLTALLSLVVVALAACTLVVHAFGTQRRTVEKADAIVVAGARVLPPGIPSDALHARVVRAVALHHAGLAPFVLFTGGAYSGLPSEAKVSETLAVSLGLPPEAALLEEASTSTLGNAHFGSDVLKARRLTRILLVTDGFHLLRATRLFRAKGLEVQPVSAERAMPLHRQLVWALREALAMLRYGR